MPQNTEANHSKRRALLLDGHAFIYQAFYATHHDPFRDRSGRNVSVPRGILRFLLKTLDEHEFSHIGFAMEGGYSGREKIHPEYKSSRDEKPEDLAQQIPMVEALMESIGIRVLQVDGYEADDVIATVTENLRGIGLDVVIGTFDKDFLQLVRPGVEVWMPQRGRIEERWITETNMTDHFPVPAHQVVDYLALAGDSSDDIPGCPGIGKKTAPKLLAEFGTLEELLAARDTVENTRARNALAAGVDSTLMSQRLVRMIRDVPIGFDVQALQSKPIDPGMTYRLLRGLALGKFQDAAQDVGTVRTPDPAKQLELF